MSIRSKQDIALLIEADAWMMDALQAAERLNLPDWWIGAGFLRNKVWDAIEGKSTEVSHDVDLVYFNSQDTAPETDWQYGILVKEQDPTDKSKHTYELTEKGLDLIPIVMEMALWGTKHGSEMIIAPQEFMTELRTYRDKTYPKIHKAVAQGSSLYTGEHKVIKEEIET